MRAPARWTRPPPSEVDLIDRQANQQTLYVYDPNGGISTYQGTVGQSAQQLPQVSNPGGTTATTTSYAPQSGLRYQWQLQATLGRSVTQVRNASNVPPYATTPWAFATPQGESNANNPWSFLDANGNPTPVIGNVSTPSGRLVQAGANGPAFRETIGANVLDWDPFYYTYHNGNYGFRPTNPAYHTPDGREEDPWVYFFPDSVQITLTDSVKADNPIAITFAGPSQASVAITSNAPVVQDGNIVNPAGTTSINAPGLTQGPAAGIETNNLAVSSSGGVGTASHPLAASLTGNGTLNVAAGSPGAYLDLGTGAIVANVAATSGPVAIDATGDLHVAPGNTRASVVTGSDLTIRSSGGEIGSASAALPILATGVVNASALKGINLTQANGDLRAGQILSTTGNVAVNAPGGRILDAGLTTWAGVVGGPQSQQVWVDLGLTDGSPAQVNQNVAAFQGEVDARYQDFWQLVRNGTVTIGTLTLSPDGVARYRGQAAVSLGINDPKKVTDAQVRTYANDRFQDDVAFFNKNLGPDWRSLPEFRTYDPNYRYSATAQQKADLTSNAAWTANQLGHAVPLVALDPASGNPVGLTSPNVSGVNVTLSAGGDIGAAPTTSQVISLADLQSGNLTTAQAQAIAQATAAGDAVMVGLDSRGQAITFPYGQAPAGATVTGVQITPIAPLLIAAGADLNASGAAVILQSTAEDVTLGRVSARGGVNITAPGGIFGDGSGPHIQTTGATIILKAGTDGQGPAGPTSGTVGTAGTPLIVRNSGGPIVVYAQSQHITLNGSAGGGTRPIGPATGLAITRTGVNAAAGLAAFTLTGRLSASGESVDVLDTTTGDDLGLAAVNGTGFSLSLSLVEGTHALRVRASLGGSFADAPLFSVDVDLTPPTSHVEAPGVIAEAGIFPVQVDYHDPAGSGGAPASGVSEIDLFVSTDGGPWQEIVHHLAGPSASGTATIDLSGAADTRYDFYSRAVDAAGNVEAGSPASEAATFVGQAPTTVAVAPASGMYGSTRITATVSSAFGTPASGSVRFLVARDGQIIDGPTGALDGRGMASVSILDAPGVYSVTAQYLGDGATYAASPGSAAADVDISRATTATAVTPSVAIVGSGDLSVLTATVSSADGPTPTGSVQFLFDGVAFEVPVTLAPDGTAVIAVQGEVGSFTVTAHYLGDLDFAPSLSAAEARSEFRSLPAKSYTFVGPAKAAVNQGGSATFTADLSSDLGPLSDGSVQFLVDGVPFGASVPVSSSIAKATIVEPAGTYTVTARYSGDSTTAATTPDGEIGATLTVTPQAAVVTTTSLTPVADSVGLGQSATFTATVSSARGVPPDGKMQFLVDGVAFGDPVAFDSAGRAQLVLSEPRGVYSVAARYTGDADFGATTPATEFAATLTVASAATATTVTPGDLALGLGETATFTASVSSTEGVPPDGSVQFLVDGAAFGDPVPLSGASAKIAITEPVGTYTVAAQYLGDANFAATSPGAETTASLIVGEVSPPTNLAISPDTGDSSGDGVTDTGAVTFTGDLSSPGMTVSVFDAKTGRAYGDATVTGTTFRLALDLAEGVHVLDATATLGGTSALGSLTVRVDLTPPTSHVVDSLGAAQTADSFPVTVAFADPNGSGVSSVDLDVSVNGGPFGLAQTRTLASPAASGEVTFTFVGQDRNLYAFHAEARDVAGNAEAKDPAAIEASTAVPDLHPPVTHVLASAPAYSWSPFPPGDFAGFPASSYAQGVFTLDWAGADPDRSTGVPPGSIARINIYAEVDGGAPALVGHTGGGTPDGIGVSSGSITYAALADGLPHSYGFFSEGVDDLGVVQAAPSTPDATFADVAYTPALAVQDLVVQSGIAERSFIRTLDVRFNQAETLPGSVLQALATGLAGGTPDSFVELLWYGEHLTAQSQPVAGVNLFDAGTSAVATLDGRDLKIDFGASGITGLLASSGVSGGPTRSFGDGWYALGIDPTGDPSHGQVFWLPFFRLLGDTDGDGAVTGPYSAANTDAAIVYHAEGTAGPLLDADVNGDGTVNTRDLIATAGARGRSVGATAPANFPQFQVIAGMAAGPGAAPAITPAEVSALLPQAIDAWAVAGLDAADLDRLRGVQVRVGDLGTSILGLEAAGTITINQTAAGHAWDVDANPAPAEAGEVDLLTVLEHELGHVIGLADNAQAGDLMDTTLGPGVRRAPTEADVAGVSHASHSPLVAASPASPAANLPTIGLAAPAAGIGPAPKGLLDAALASIMSGPIGAGRASDHPEARGTTALLVGGASVVGVRTKPKGHEMGRHPGLAHPGRLLPSLFSHKGRRPSATSDLGPKSPAKGS